MPAQSPTKPVEDSVRKINDELAVGSDLEFQRRWWRFEAITWTAFTALVILAALGFFGRGHFANARLKAPDGSMDVQYERIERYGTPSVVRIEFGPSAIHDGKVRLWAGETLVKPLGNQRVIPQPATSEVGDGGILYTFPVTSLPAFAEFALEPESAGSAALKLRVPGAATVTAHIFVMP
jgi:hypothetical protein